MMTRFTVGADKFTVAASSGSKLGRATRRAPASWRPSTVANTNGSANNTASTSGRTFFVFFSLLFLLKL
jgi:hypothetical protein